MELAVICSHFNPSGFHASRRNLLRFLRQLGSQGLPVFVAELAYEDEPFFLPLDPCFFQFRGDYSNTLWHKENLLNLAVQQIPLKYDKIAWIDPDLFFMSKDWVEHTVKALDDFAVVQLYSDAWWTDQDGRCYKQMRSTMADGVFETGYNHPGFAWAARRELWTRGGGLCELAILGGGDALLAGACLDDEVPSWMHYPNWKQWISRSKEWIWKNGGGSFIPGTIVHEWHGADSDRSYVARHSLHQSIDISSSIVRRTDGLLQFADTVPNELRDAFRNYFVQRSEDGIPII